MIFESPHKCMGMYVQSLLNMFIVHLQNASTVPGVGDLRVEKRGHCSQQAHSPPEGDRAPTETRATHCKKQGQDQRRW